MAKKYNIVLGAKIDTITLEQQLKGLSGKYKIDFGAGKATGNVQSLTKGLDNATSSTKSFAKATKDSATNTGLLNQNLTSAIGKFTAWYLIAGVVTSIIGKIKDVVVQVKALDKAMTSLQMVTQYTDSQMQDLKQTYIELAQDMGVTVATVASGADEFLRAGLNATEANDALRASITLSTIANMDSATSTQYLIATMNAYGLKANQLMSVVDKLSAVDISAATSSQELGEALSVSASSAQLAGIEFDKYLAMIATVSETTRQSASAIGNSFKTIFARLQEVRLGSLLDKEGEDISKVDKLLKQYGIDLMEVTDNLNNMEALIDKLGASWNNYSVAQKSEIATTVAGVRQRDKLLALLNNYDRVLSLTEISTESAGSAQEKYNIYLDSTEAKVNALSSAWTELATTTLNSGTVEFFLELTTAILKTQTVFGGLTPLFLGLLSIIMLIKGQQIVSGITNTITAIKAMATALKTATLSAQGLMTALSLITAAISIGIMAYSAITTAIKKKREAEEAERATVVESANTQISKIKELKDEYDTLLGTENKSETQQSRMVEIFNLLTKAYGGASKAADGYRNSVEILNETTKDALLLQYQSIIEANKKAYQKAEKELGKTIKIKFGGGEVDVGELAKAGLKIDNTSSFWEAFTGQNVKKIKGNYEEQVKSLKSANQYYEKLMVERAKLGQGLTEKESTAYSFIKTKLESLQSEYSNYVSVIEETKYAEEALEHIKLGDYFEWVKGSVDSATDSVDDLTKSYNNLTQALTDTQKALQEKLDTEKEENDELKKQEQLQEKLLAIEEARVALAEAQRKKVRVYRAGIGFTYVADESEVQKAQENLQKAQKEKADYEKDLAMKQKQELIDSLGDLINSMGDIDGSAVLSVWDTFFNEFGMTFSTFYSEELDNVEKFIKDYKGKLAGEDTADEVGTRHKWTSYEDAAKAGYSNIAGASRSERGRVAKQYGSYQNYLDAMYEKYMGESPKYAKGTDSASGGLSMVGEKGAEMRVLNKGDGIIPSNITRNLMAIGSNPALLGKLVESNNSQIINVGRVEVNGVNDVDGFIQELSLIASR